MLRAASKEDIDQIYEMELQSFGQDSFNKRQLLSLIKGSNDFIVDEDNNEITGSIIILHKSNSTKSRIYSIVVHPKYRGRGIASNLINEAKRITKSLGGKEAITLEVRKDNDLAIRLYEKTGFKEIKELRHYYHDRSVAIQLICFVQ